MIDTNASPQEQIDTLVRSLVADSGLNFMQVRRLVEKAFFSIRGSSAASIDKTYTDKLVDTYVDKVDAGESKLARATTTIAISNLIDEARGAA